MRLFTAIATAIAASLLLVHSTFAQTFPTKPPRLLVGFVPGGGVDQTARIATAKLTEIWGQAVTVENKTGAGGTIAADTAARSAPDGYTLVLCNVGSHGIGPSLYRKLQYDAIRDVTYIGLIGLTPNMFAVHPSVPATTVAEFIAYARANPGKLSYGSSGVGTSTHLGVELFRSMTGIQVVHVPYKGGAASSADLVGGQVQFVITNLPEQVGYVRSGRTRALGVSTAKRTPAFPDVPTIGETVPGYEVTVWYGICGPGGMQKALVDRINADLVKAVTSSEIVKRYADAGVEVAPGTAEQFTEFARAEQAKWAQVVKDSGASAD